MDKGMEHVGLSRAWMAAFALLATLGVAIAVIGAREGRAHLLFGGSMFVVIALTGVLYLSARRPGRDDSLPSHAETAAWSMIGMGLAAIHLAFTWPKKSSPGLIRGSSWVRSMPQLPNVICGAAAAGSAGLASSARAGSAASSATHAVSVANVFFMAVFPRSRFRSGRSRAAFWSSETEPGLKFHMPAAASMPLSSNCKRARRA